MNPLTQLKTTAPLLIALTLLGFALSPIAQAVVPAPDGGYPGQNTAEGQNALLSLNVNAGTYNTAVGWFALRSNVEGQFNTAVGAGTLFNNTAHRNTAIGGAAMFSNTVGTSNTAVGMLSLFTNSTGSNNTAVGDEALNFNTEGDANTAIGLRALLSNTTGTQNTANGGSALGSNTTGTQNTADGAGALLANSTGSNNTALGYIAGSNIRGSGNVCIGAFVDGDAGVDDSTWIRNINTTLQSFVGGINNYVTVRMSDGRLGFTSVVSSRRYKEDIKPMDKASEALLALKPVTFRLKGELDPSHRPQWGLIAEEVERVNPDLVDRNNKGEVESVRYDAVNAMLLNEFQKEHRKNEEQQAIIAELKKAIARLTARDEEQAAQIQKVSAQLEASKPAPQVVNNP